MTTSYNSKNKIDKLKKRLDIVTDLYTMILYGIKDETVQLDSINIQKEIAEIYYLRDLYMELDPKKQVEWGFQKLRQNSVLYEFLDEIYWLEGTSDNHAFYDFCSMDALMYLGY